MENRSGGSLSLQLSFLVRPAKPVALLFPQRENLPIPFRYIFFGRRGRPGL